MIGTIFPYSYKGKSTYKGVTIELYTFRCGLNISYIVEVEEHPYQIFVIKFFQKNHRHSKNRYSLLNSERFLRRHNTRGVRNFLHILNTITDLIIKRIYKPNSLASFGFLGAPTKNELEEKNSKNINPDGTVVKTKRFNVYGMYVKRYFSPEKFEHIELETSSGYLIKSRSNLTLTTDKVEEFFDSYINEFC